jgi:hypothetical protein
MQADANSGRTFDTPGVAAILVIGAVVVLFGLNRLVANVNLSASVGK